ncbi:hypothetical protein QJQ45_024995 [Haematococcus lacustris]|nr:hypothetical protein QJQ45_024995 [Haematococcus lacustris]
MCSFYDRDVSLRLSAALNIRRCAVGPGPRPTELCIRDGRPAMPKPGRPGQEWTPPSGSDPEAVTQVARVDTGDAIEQLQLPVSSPHSSLVTVTLRSPMGLVLEESAPACVQVAEVVPGGAAATAQVRVGDRVRAVTAATMQMTYPTANLLLGGVGRPRLKRVALPATGRSLAWVSGALRSNADLEGGQATLVLERAGGAELQLQQRGQGRAQGLREAEAEGADKDAGGSIFDPSLFE